MPETAIGSVRFELTGDRGTDSWRIVIDQGDVRVLHDAAAAVCTVCADRELFDEVVTGRANAMTALLRGALSIEGNPEALVLVQRLFSGAQDGLGPSDGSDPFDGPGPCDGQELPESARGVWL